MRKLSWGRALSRLCISPVITAHAHTSSSSSSSSSSCLCFGNKNHASTQENKPLIPTRADHVNSMKLKDVIAGVPTLAFHLKPKMVVMRVSMHCNGCARKVEKHISKLEGVTSYHVDLETKMVVVTGDIVPFEVLESVSKLKNAQLWDNQSHT